MASPFRYPGAKGRLLPAINKYLRPLLDKTTHFHDVFVGGGSVLINVASTDLSQKLYANDLDERIFSFWQLTLENDKAVNQFYEMLDVKPTVEMFKKLRATKPTGLVEKAYHAVFFNRCTFSGIATSGPIGGYDQKSEYPIDCRYNAVSLIKRFKELRRLFSGRLTVYNLPFQDYIPYIVKDNEVMYLDPPYYQQGPELYPVFMKPEEHKELAEILIGRERNWVLSYDKCDEIDQLYGWADRIPINATYSVKQKSNRKTQEYVII